jgi:hypothetical protein
VADGEDPGSRAHVSGSFRNQSWNNRFQEMGDTAEAIFEATIGRGFVRFGLNRPPLQVHKLPAKIRYAPDYLTSTGFYEVQGCGRDGVLKLKDEKLVALGEWNQDFDTFLWVYDQTNHRYAWAHVGEIVHDLDKFRKGMFPEGKPYFELPIGWTRWNWTAAP